MVQKIVPRCDAAEHFPHLPRRFAFPAGAFRTRTRQGRTVAKSWTHDRGSVTSDQRARTKRELEPDAPVANN